MPEATHKLSYSNYLPTAVAYISLSGLVLSQLTDNMHIIVTTTDANGNLVTLSDFYGDFLGATLDDVINAIVVEINLSGTGYTATNANPRIKIEIETDANLAGISITIDFEPCFYLRGDVTNLRTTIMTALGYGALTPVRPSYVKYSSQNPSFTAGGRLYVPNGDDIWYIYPNTNVANAPPAGATPISITKDFTGAILGSVYQTFIAPGLTQNYFTANSEFEFRRTVIDVNGRTLGGVVTVPLSDYSNIYAIRFKINAYNVVTGQLDYEVVANPIAGFTTGVTWQSSAIAAIPTLTAVDAPYNPAPPAYGTLGGTAIGSGVWTFIERGHGWSTLSVFDVTNPTSQTTILTFVQNIEIPVRISGAGESLHDTLSNSVFISGFGADLLAAAIVKIDLTANPLNYSGSVNLVVAGNRVLVKNPLTGNIYASNNVLLSKIDTLLNYDSTVNQSVPSRSITHDSGGIIYVAPEQTQPMVIRKMQGIPAVAYNTADPIFDILFTAPDFQNAVTLPLLNYNFDGAINGQAGFASVITAGLNSSTTIIWIAGATFRLERIIGATTYTINCVITSYNNGSGGLVFSIASITQTTGGVTTSASPLAGTGLGNWTYAATPYIQGAINIYLHTNGILYATRATNVGGIIHSYDLSLPTEAAIIASRVIIAPPNNAVLSGNMSYQDVANRILLPTSNGQLVYVFNPDLSSFEACAVPQPNGGMQLFSYTGDDVNMNMFADTPTGSRASVVSVFETNDQFTGLFYNLSVNDSNCPFCYEYPLIACYDNYVFDLDLAPNTVFNIILIDKFLKKYRQQITSDDEGKITLDPDPFPDGFFTPENGSLTMEITDINNLPVEILFGYTIYTCLTLTFEYNNLYQ